MGDYCEPPAKRPAHSPLSQQQSRNSGGATDAANVTLWQFLLDLLLKQQYSNIICWTNNEGEFKLLDAEHVAKLWGLKKNKHNMNYDKLSRALRYYYDKNIIKKVMGQKFVYKFVSFPEMVKTENRIPFKKKMESIVNDSNPTATSSSSTAASSFQALRPYDVKSGLIQQAQLAAQHQMLQHAQAMMVEQKYQIPPEHHALYHSDNITVPKKVSESVTTKTEPVPPPAHQQQLHASDLSRRPSPPVSPVSVCTPAGSPSPAPVFDLPGSGTPTPPPKPATPVRPREPEINVKLEIPELDDNRNCSSRERNGSVAERRLPRQSKTKPDPISISNDVHVSTSAVSPLINRSILPSLNTPMFLTSPMFGQRTPLIPGIHFWGPGTLSPVATLSPRLGGHLPPGPAFQFPNFAVSPATLNSFSSFSDNVFSTGVSTPNTVASDKKISTS